MLQSPGLATFNVSLFISFVHIRVVSISCYNIGSFSLFFNLLCLLNSIGKQEGSFSLLPIHILFAITA